MKAKVQFTLELGSEEDITEEGIILWIQEEIGGKDFKVEFEGREGNNG